MLYELMCLVIAAFGAYGLYVSLSHLLRAANAEECLPVLPGILLRPGFSEEEVEEALLLLREAPDPDPVLLVDVRLRPEILEGLAGTGAALYLSYEEYYREKRE